MQSIHDFSIKTKRQTSLLFSMERIKDSIIVPTEREMRKRRHLCNEPSLQENLSSGVSDQVKSDHAAFAVTVTRARGLKCLTYKLESSYEPRHGKTCFFAYAKTKTQISCAATRTADQRLCFRYTNSTFPLLIKSEISSL